MTITKRGAAVLIAGSFVAGVASHMVIPAEPSQPDLVRYEDGSGVLYEGDREVRTYPEGTFPWDCATMGNRLCGDIDDADVTP